MKKGTILGHEGVGIVEEIGPQVKEIKVGDRVVVCSTIACGRCLYCQSGEYSSCDNANPNGAEAGTAFFGGPATAGSYNGLQAERARIPYADTTLVRLPDGIKDEDAILISDIFPTGYMGAEIADVRGGDIVAVFGCGPVGQMAIASAKFLGASKVIAVDCLPDRLDMARSQGAVVVNYDEEDPVKALKDLSNGFGPDACIDAVGVDAQRPHHGPAKKGSLLHTVEYMMEQHAVAPWTVPVGSQWRQGDAPSQVLIWCLESVRKSGVISVIGVYPATAKFFPIGMAMQKSLTMRTANCSHRKYIPKVIQLMEESNFRPSTILTKMQPINEAVDSYKHFDKREPGWLKVEILPQDWHGATEEKSKKPATIR